jgi:hypothetical protein
MNSLWCTVAPINYEDPFSSLSVPFEFERGVKICEVPEWLKSESFANYLNGADRSLLLKDVQYTFYSEYETDGPGTPELCAQHEAIDLANLALWLAKPNGLGFSAIFDVDGLPSDPNFRSFQEVRKLEPHMRYENIYLTLDDQKRAKDLHAVLLTLSRTGSLWRSVFSLWQALTQGDWATRYLLLWISLESLFGPEDTRELSYRLSQRIGFFLASDRREASSVFETARKGYNWRSKVVHGLHLSKLGRDDSNEISFAAEDLVNQSLNKILHDRNLPRLFDSKEREGYLDSLPFKN